LTEVGSRAARVLLLTDLNSRIPVVVENSRINAVLAGDNSERPHLIYIGEPDSVKIGDRVVSSGEGGVFPPGLPVGVVAALGPGGPRIETYAELSQLGYVLVVDYGLSGALPQPLPVAPRANRRGKPNDAADCARRSASIPALFREPGLSVRMERVYASGRHRDARIMGAALCHRAEYSRSAQHDFPHCRDHRDVSRRELSIGSSAARIDG